MEFNYNYEEIKRCHYCKMWIEYRMVKMMCNRTFFYFHPTCLEIYREKINI